jgi:hypothetical protein
MGARLSIVAGLVVGIAVAALVLGGLVALTPDPTAPPTPAPASTPTAAPSVAVSAAPSASLVPIVSPPGASASPPGPSASPPGGSASPPGAAAFHVDGALGGIGPDVMATGVKTIPPGVDVTP